MARLNEKAWAQLKAYKLDLNAKRYQRLPTEPKTEREGGTYEDVTNKKTPRGVSRTHPAMVCMAHLGWGARPCEPGIVLCVVGMVFAGLWLTFECAMGIIKRQIGCSRRRM